MFCVFIDLQNFFGIHINNGSQDFLGLHSRYGSHNNDGFQDTKVLIITWLHTFGCHINNLCLGFIQMTVLIYLLVSVDILFTIFVWALFNRSTIYISSLDFNIQTVHIIFLDFIDVVIHNCCLDFIN